MRDLQIFILDLQGNQLGELDLNDVDSFALKLTKSIASIQDIGRRNTSFSLDFEAPQTKNNNKLLAGLRFATATKEILGKKPCAIMVDGNQVDRGFLYPFESSLNGDYKLVFKGLNNDWVEQLRDVELNQLEWLDYDTGLRSEDATEVFSGTRMSYLNTQNSETEDLIYPAMNRNNGGATEALRPQLHLRSIILRMFEKIGYSVSSAFIESDWIKGNVAFDDSLGNPYTHLGLSVDPAFQLEKDEQDLLGTGISYKTTGITGSDPNSWDLNACVGNIGLTPAAPNIRTLYRFPNFINGLILDENNRFDPVTSEYTVPVSGVYELTFSFGHQWAFFYDVSNQWEFWTNQVSELTTNPPSFKWYIVKNNTSNDSIDGKILHETIPYSKKPATQNTGTPNSNIEDSLPVTRFHTFATGDKISVFLGIEDEAAGNIETELNNPSLPYWRLIMLNDSVLSITAKAELQLGDVFRINSHIPKGVKCLTLLQDFKTLFNLYFDVDPLRRIVYIEPRDNFYLEGATDITDKIDFNTAPSLNYLSDYKNEMVFEYKTDTKDKYLEQWNKVHDREYGKYTYVMGNNSRFEKGQSTLKTSLLSATIQGNLNGTTNIMTSIIKEQYLDKDNEGKPVNKNYGMRIFQLVRGRQYEPSGIARRTVSPLEVTVAIMEEYSNTPTFEDRKLTFVGYRGLVWDYYTKTLANIEDTAILELRLNLGMYDYKAWNLRGVFYISEPAEIAGYYITDSVKNFNVTKEAMTSVTLVKFKDFTPVTVEGGTGNVNEITDNVPDPQPILCTVNGAIVNCLDNDLQIMFKI
jgi:hypothetical protein